jgi:hypothetical protein
LCLFVEAIRIDYCFDVMLHMDPGHPSTQVDINKQPVEIGIFSCDTVVAAAVIVFFVVVIVFADVIVAIAVVVVSVSA